MITAIRLQNFKGHVDTTVRLGRLTLLVGPNGAGKTSVLRGLHLLYRAVRVRVHGRFWTRNDPGDLLRRGSTDSIIIAAQGADGSIPWRMSASVTPEAPTAVPPRPLSIVFDWGHGESSGIHEAKLVMDSTGWCAPELILSMGQARLYRFNTERISAATEVTTLEPKVAPDGGDTAAVLASLKLEQEEVFDRIQAELRKIVPIVERIRIRRAWVDEDDLGHKIYLDFHGAPNIPANEASEGTLITLALLTALFSPSHPNLVLLDDLDHALHPEAQSELIRQLKRLLEEMPDLQIVATTHSPYLLDELSPDDVQVFALRKDGSVATKRLSEHPQAQAAAGLTAGQLWSLDPERRWVAEED